MTLESLTDRRLRELEDQRDKAEAVAHILQGQLTERTRERDAARDLALILEEDHERLFRALADALDGMEDMIGYVPDFFRDKWDHYGYIERARLALTGTDEDAA